MRIAVPYGPLSMSWANEICGADAEERALVIGIMNAAGYAFNAWLPYLTFPTVDAPRFRKGWIWSTSAFVAQFGITGLVAWLWRREKQARKKTEEQPDQITEQEILTGDI
jgi:ACS family pantothenate transporter-like MFS transporter